MITKNYSSLKFFTALTLFMGNLVYLLSYVNGALLYENKTASAPQGIYYMAMDQRLRTGDYAIVKLPRDLPGYKLKKGYLLLKKVAATQGTGYKVTEKHLVITENRPVTADNSRSIVSRYYPIYDSPSLPRLPAGEFIVPEGAYLFLNDPETSLDSRYLGPIHSSQVVAKVNLLFDYNELAALYFGFFPKEMNCPCI